jgi:hypothetical protein
MDNKMDNKMDIQTIKIEKINDKVSVLYDNVDDEESFTLLLAALWNFINDAPDGKTRKMLKELAKNSIDIKFKELKED